MDLLLLLLVLLAVAAAGLAGDALGRARAGSLTARVTAERDAARVERDGLRSERDAARAECGVEADRARDAATQVAALTTALQHERAAAQDKVELLAQAQERLRETFGSLSAEALARNNEAFVQLAQSRLGELQARASGDLTQRQQAIDALVAPLRDSLAKVQDQLSQVERARTAAYASLQEQVRAMSSSSDQLRTETAQLVTALRAPQVRGRWGEMQLRRVVEAAGMLEHCDFSEQVSVETADGARRPDLVVHLAGGKRVVVDAKVAFSGYLEAMEARDEATRATRLKAHARHLRQHVDQLADKAYWQHFEPTPEFVVLFVPADAFLHAALEEDPSLLEHAFARNVVLTTPANLVALLRTIAYTWRQEALAANAQQVLSLGRELHGRLATMGTHMSKLGNQLGSAVDAYNKSVSSLESRVLVTARRFGDLHVTDDELPPPRQVEVVTRQLQAPELVASVNEQLVVLPEPTPEPPRQPHARGAGTG